MLKGVFAKNERGYRHTAKNKCLWSLPTYFYLLGQGIFSRTQFSDFNVLDEKEDD